MQHYHRPSLCATALITLNLVLSFYSSGASAEQGGTGPRTQCPPGFPPGADCTICGTDADCLRTARSSQVACDKGVAYSPASQVKRYSCNSTDSLVASLIAPGALFQCGSGVLTNQSTAASAGAAAEGAPLSCEVGLTGDGNPIYCQATECSVKNTSMVVCRSMNCSCTGGCSVGDAGAVSLLVSAASQGFTFGCKGQPDNCSLLSPNMPLGPIPIVCDVGECMPKAKSDAAVLLEFKDNFVNGEEVLSDWSLSNGGPCTWSGVSCNADGAVVSIGLYERWLRGTIPLSGWPLPDTLTSLMLAYSSLEGTLPPDPFFPKSLRRLWLYGNSLEGSMPAWNLSRIAPQLDFLDLGVNKLSGEIPGNWPLGNTLQTLRLHCNNFSGTLPPLSFPPTMRELNLTNNTLAGTFGDWSATSLQILDFSNNSLAGSLPTRAQLPPSLKLLKLQDNRLTGTLPAWRTEQNLSIVVEGGNVQLCGEVPSSPGYEEQVVNWSQPSRLSSLPTCSNANGSSAAGTGGGDSSITPVVAGVVGGCALLAAATGLAVWYRARKRRRQPVKHSKHPELVKAFATPPGVELASNPSRLSSGGTVATDNSRGLLLPLRRGDTLSSNNSLPPPRSGLQHAQSMPASPQTLESLDRVPWGLDASADDVGEQRESTDGVEAAEGQKRKLMHLSDSLGKNLDLKMWLIDHSQLELVEEIGAGSFGKVYLGNWHGTQVAVKQVLSNDMEMQTQDARMRALTMSSPVFEGLKKEALFLAALRHPNVVMFIGITREPPCIVTEFCSRGSVTKVLQEARHSPAAMAELPWSRRLSLLQDAAQGMLYLHNLRPPVIHRDLKSPNLLVDLHYRVKVTDFNLSRLLEENYILSSAQATNPRWLAPEVMEGHPATLQSDIFGFAVVMWEVLTLRVPFDGRHENYWSIVKLLRRGGRLPIPPREEVPGLDTASFSGLDAYVALMQRCWAQEPEERPSFLEISQALRELQEGEEQRLQSAGA